jgi:uncharacterized protein
MARKPDSQTPFFMSCVREKALELIKENSYAGHDETHTIRVHELSMRIGKKEKADLQVIAAAALLHDAGRSFEKQDPLVDHAEVSAGIAEKLLKECGFPEEKIPEVLYAIRAHRFSQQKKPDTLEARILQDADRIDISGAVGIAMTFAYGGAKNMKLYDSIDPLAKVRTLDDDKYVLDHFQRKILKLEKTIHTKTGKQLIRQRHKYLISFMNQFIREISSAK